MTPETSDARGLIDFDTVTRLIATPGSNRRRSRCSTTSAS